MDSQPVDSQLRHRVGRPRRGTEAQRTDELIGAATRVFLRDGYGSTSIDKVATEAGMSTRTIYERFKNKGELLGAVIRRLLQRSMGNALSPQELHQLEPRQALRVIGELVSGQALDPDACALFRILATEAQRFPDLARDMRTNAKELFDNAIADYFRAQVERGVLTLADPEKAAVLFVQMVRSDINECLLFGSTDEIASLDFLAHLQLVIDVFLNGVAVRGRQPTGSS